LEKKFKECEKGDDITPFLRYSTQKLEKFETEKNITIHGGMLILPDYTNSLKVLPIILLYINLLNLFQQKAREDTLMNR
jgi:hypothetical protein